MMKKMFLALAVMAAVLLLGSAALAAGHPCDLCGGETTLEGSGAWCHWYCAKCDYTTSRNHDPNSYNSGLVPDSCSGYCQWCGAPAQASSHTFTTWTLDGNATCTQDGTETARCDNAQCWATNTRTAVGSALGHDYATQVVAPLCQEEGYTIYTCSRCGETHNDDVVSALGHTYGEWTCNSDGTHTAQCIRWNSCFHSRTADCAAVTTVVGGKEMTLCPVCGYVTWEGGDLELDADAGAQGEMADGSALPGKLMVLIDAAPLEVQIETDAFYMFVTAFQRNGQVTDWPGKVLVSIDLNEHPFQMESAAFKDMLPAELNAKAIKIVRVEYEMIEDKLTEVWYEAAFTLEEGKLTFEAEEMGTYLMVLKIAEPPMPQ